MRYGISDSDFPNLHRDNGDQVVTLGAPNFRQAISSRRLYHSRMVL